MNASLLMILDLECLCGFNCISTFTCIIYMVSFCWEWSYAEYGPVWVTKAVGNKLGKQKERKTPHSQSLDECPGICFFANSILFLLMHSNASKYFYFMD